MADEPRGGRVTAKDIAELTASFHGVRDAVEDMTARQTTTEERVEEKADTSQVESLRRVVAALALLIAAVVFLALVTWRNNSARIDDFERARAESRAGFCVTVNDMRAKHNHFVQTVIDERQAIIDDIVAAHPDGLSESQQASVDFFTAQIASYRQDLQVIVDCTEPAAVNDLFTTTTSSGSG